MAEHVTPEDHDDPGGNANYGSGSNRGSVQEDFGPSTGADWREAWFATDDGNERIELMNALLRKAVGSFLDVGAVLELAQDAAMDAEDITPPPWERRNEGFMCVPSKMTGSGISVGALK